MASYTLDSRLRNVREYNAGRAVDFLRNPAYRDSHETVREKGLDDFLPDSSIVNQLAAAKVLIRGGRIESKLKSGDPKNSEYVREALERFSHGQNYSDGEVRARLRAYKSGISRRGFLKAGAAIVGAGLAEACSDDTRRIIGPTPIPGPTTSTTVINGSIGTTIGQRANGGIIEYLDGPDGNPVASGNIGPNGTFEVIIENYMQGRIGRVRMRDSNGAPLNYLSCEFDVAAPIAAGRTNTFDYMIGARTAGIPILLDAAIRARSPIGNKRTSGQYTFTVDMNSEIQNLSEGERIARMALLEGAIRRRYPELTNQSFIPGTTLRLSNDPQSIGGNNIAIEFTVYKASVSSQTFENFRLVGSRVELPAYGTVDWLDLQELTTVLRLYSESNDYKPSLANNNVSQSLRGVLQPVDLEMVIISNLEALGTNRYRSRLGFDIESYEIPNAQEGSHLTGSSQSGVRSSSIQGAGVNSGGSGMPSPTPNSGLPQKGGQITITELEHGKKR
jgi:hypothetical protein